MKVKLTVAYDGTDYVGWQYQPNGVSVQQRLEEAVEKLTGIIHPVYSSGRTDAGVHARGMACHLVTEKDLPLSAWREGVNRFLPDDIAVRTAEFVGEDFHARFSARSKVYRYSLLRDPIRSPLDRLTTWRVSPALDLGQMKAAAQRFVGEHDFAAFRTSGCSAENNGKKNFRHRFQRRRRIGADRHSRQRLSEKHGSDDGRYAGRNRTREKTGGRYRQAVGSKRCGPPRFNGSGTRALSAGSPVLSADRHHGRRRNQCFSGILARSIRELFCGNAFCPDT